MAPTSGFRASLPLVTLLLLVGLLAWIALRLGSSESSIGAAEPGNPSRAHAHTGQDLQGLRGDGAAPGGRTVSPAAEEARPAPGRSGAGAAAPSPGQAPLRVTVLDPHGGLAEGVAVAVTRREARGTQILDLAYQSASVELERGRTGPDGTVTFGLPRGRSFELLVPAEDSLDLVPQRVGCRAGQEVTVTLGLGGRARGRVRDESGAPIAGATVEVWGDPRQASAAPRVLTDADGSYDLRGLPTSTFMLLVSAPGFAVGFSDRLEIPPGTQLERDFRLERGLVVRGRVIDRRSREPLPGAEVAHSPLWKWSVRTDDEGRFQLAGVEPNSPTEAMVHVRAEGWAATEVSFQLADAEEELVVRMRRGPRVVGRAVDQDGSPIEGAFAHLFGTMHVAGHQAIDTLSRWSGKDGSFEFAGVRTDMAHTLLVRAPGYGAALVPVKRSLRDQDLGPIHLAPEARILGRVLDPGGAPLPGSEVTLRGASLADELMGTYLETWEIVCEADGVFLFEGIPPGAYTLEASVPGSQERVRRELTLAAGDWIDDLTLDFRIVGGEILGLVRLPDGSPAVSASVWLAGPEGSEDTHVRTDAEGRFRFRGLAAGPYAVRARPPREHAATSYQVRRTGIEPDGVELELELLRGSPVAGIVLTPLGEPAPGAQVTASLEGATIAWGTAGPGGAFSMTVPADSLVDLRATPAPNTTGGGTQAQPVMVSGFTPLGTEEDPPAGTLTGVEAGTTTLVLQL